MDVSNNIVCAFAQIKKIYYSKWWMLVVCILFPFALSAQSDSLNRPQTINIEQLPSLEKAEKPIFSAAPEESSITSSEVNTIDEESIILDKASEEKIRRYSRMMLELETEKASLLKRGGNSDEIDRKIQKLTELIGTYRKDK
jgi:hypothetical protein